MGAAKTPKTKPQTQKLKLKHKKVRTMYYGVSQLCLTYSIVHIPSS
jgi:hypothetical protein